MGEAISAERTAEFLAALEARRVALCETWMRDETNPADAQDEEVDEEIWTISATSDEKVDCKEVICTPPRNSDSDVEGDIFRLSLNRSSIERGTTCPWEGKTYVIIEKASKRVMTLRNGVVVLIDTKGLVNHFIDVSCYWHCIEDEQSRWWGLCNAVTGMYLGEGRRVETLETVPLVACSEYLSKSRWIYSRQHPDGGCELFINRREVLAAICINDKEDASEQILVVGGIGSPARWDFMEV